MKLSIFNTLVKFLFPIQFYLNSVRLLKVILYSILFQIFASGTINAQSTIDFGLIKQKKVKKAIKRGNLCSTLDFEQVKSSCLCNEDIQYNTHRKSYLFNFDVKKVWDAYLSIPPKKAWNDKIVSFGMMYEAEKHMFHYVDEKMPPARVGQLVFINLHLLKGFINVAVAHKIMEINETEKLIRTCYVESGVSKGTQFVRFYDLGNNQTKVEHITFYRSESRFRDKHLYPFLHEKVITEFHQNINHYLIISEKKSPPSKAKNLVRLNKL